MTVYINNNVYLTRFEIITVTTICNNRTKQLETWWCSAYVFV